MTASDLIIAGIVGYGAAALGYLALTAFVILRQRRSDFSGLMLVAASFSSFLWAAVLAFDFYQGGIIGPTAHLLDIFHSCAWAILLLGLLYWLPPVKRTSLAAAIFGSCLVVAALSLIQSHAQGTINAAVVLIGGQLVLAVVGLGLVENLFRNSPAERHWSVKYLCLGAGALFAYDFYLFADALLFRRLDPELFVARGVANLLVTPLLAVYAKRNRSAGPQIAVSRRFALYSATVMGAGIYLMTMAVAGYYVRRFGGTWSGFLQTIFFFGTILLVLVPLASGSFRAYLRIFVEKSLFKYKYDYRAEWLRFIQTVSSDLSGRGLRMRVVQAVADIVDSPEGGVWLRQPDGSFALTAAWNLSRWTLKESEATFPRNGAFIAFLERMQWIINLNELATAPERYETLAEIPAWVTAIARAWLIVPLFHHETLFGMMLLGQPRAPRELSWEDFDILKTVARQAASYLAEQAASEALTEARQFEAFNKRFAFVAHDIKNLASQLSLILSNAAKHRGNLQFQDDVIETVRQSVDKINRMLKQLHAEPGPELPTRRVALAPLLRQLVEALSQAGSAISLELADETLSVAADEDRLKAVVEHLVQNALEAVGTTGQVRIRLVEDGSMVLLEIEDNGPGMDAEFVRDKLFQPFVTTKGLGYGIGVYESRDFARSLGGRLDVTSEPGRGTTMRMRLPAAASS